MSRLASIACICGLAVALFAPPSDAQESPGSSDFDPAATAWNGLATLVSTAAEVKLQLTVATALDWRQIDEHSVLVLVAPRVTPDDAALASLRRFLEAGGRMVLADDFGAGAAWLAPYGLELKAEPVKSSRHYDDLPHLPQVAVDPDDSARRVARRWSVPGAKVSAQQFLSHNIKAPIVLNHPASLRIEAGRTGALWGTSLAPGVGWLAEVEHRGGRILAVADPSLLLNAMLIRFHDNKQFAANALRYYCVLDRPCRVTLVAGATQVLGTFRPKPREAPASLRSGLEQAATFLTWLAEALRGPLAAPMLAMAVLALLGVPALLLARPRPPVLPPRPALVRSNSILFDTVGAWLAQDQADYRRPARLLASHLARLVGHVDSEAQRGNLGRAPRTSGRMRGAGDTGFPAQLRAQTVDQLIRNGHCSEQAGQRLREVFEELQHVAGEEVGDPISRSRFGQLAAEVEWAESLIRHTQGKPKPDDYSGTEPV